MASGFGFFKNSSDFRSATDEEFDEEDVWDVMKEHKEESSKVNGLKDFSVSSFKRFPSTSVLTPRTNSNSTAFEQSAPINIPDWSQIYRTQSFENQSSWVDGADSHGHGRDYRAANGVYHIHDDGPVDTDDWIPPHEWIAKKLARSQISSFSVCEGAGRTLKGRDLRKVRNAVLTRTGFLE